MMNNYEVEKMDSYEFEKIDSYEIVETNSYEKMSSQVALMLKSGLRIYKKKFNRCGNKR